MKGIIFTEFMEMVESNFGPAMMEDLIDKTDPPSGAVYTTVGTYDHQELAGYVVALSEMTKVPAGDLVKTFGLYLANVFASKFEDFFSECSNTLELLKKIDNHIHVEVRKLYPDAELPAFSYEEPGDGSLILNYESTRGLADLAHGLIEGSASYYDETLSISREDQQKEGKHTCRFIIKSLNS